jgi:hypothetical protein
MTRIHGWLRCILLLLLLGCAAADPPAIASTQPSKPDSSDVNPADTLPYLASDELEGRGVGLPGLDLAAKFIADEFSTAGLDKFPGMDSYFQPLDFTAKLSSMSQTHLEIDSQPFPVERDFTSLGFSGEGTFSGEVAFVGYSITDPQDKYDDFAGIDVHGKVLLAMRYEPTDEHDHSRLAKADDTSGWSFHAVLEEKAKQAAAHGAVALLLVTPPGEGPDVLLPFGNTFAAEPATIPVLHISWEVADKILADGNSPDLKKLRSQIDSTLTPQSRALANVRVSGGVKVDRQILPVKNVIACVKGHGPHADEFIIVGAHYDHLGRGRLGHQFGPTGSIYHGADDNASGTSLVLELARRFAQGPRPARTMVFICFTAEEEGLIGSDYFVKHAPIPLDKVVAMVNFDMVGRMKDDTLYMGGQGTAQDFDADIAAANANGALELKSIGRGGFGPSDHLSFAQKRIPVLFFFSGIHADYHRPTDTSDKINYAGIQEIADFSQKLLIELETMPKEPYLVEADKDSFSLFGAMSAMGGPVRHVMLGVIPDYGSENSRVGVLISGTTPGTPAADAGLQNGDLIVQFGSHPLQNLMDLSQVLEESKPGDKVTLIVLRGKQRITFDVTLAARKN